MLKWIGRIIVLVIGIAVAVGLLPLIGGFSLFVGIMAALVANRIKNIVLKKIEENKKQKQRNQELIADDKGKTKGEEKDTGKSKEKAAVKRPAFVTSVAPPFNHTITEVTADFDAKINAAIHDAKPFNKYHFEHFDVPVTNATQRPADIFMHALGAFSSNGYYLISPAKLTIPPTITIDHTKFDTSIGLHTKKSRYDEPEIDRSSAITPAALYGTNTFTISKEEIEAILKSQEIRIAYPMTVEFYKGLKAAMEADGVHKLPHDLISGQLPTLEQWAANHRNVKAFLENVTRNLSTYKLDSARLAKLKALSVWQLGSLVIKSEKFYSFVEAGTNKIRSREIGDQDSLNLISACGIKKFKSHIDRTVCQEVITEMFKGVLDAAQSGVLVMPALGLGVWCGDPKTYWKAFFAAVQANGDKVKKIIVNPGSDKSTAVFETELATFEAQNPALKNKVTNKGVGEKDILSIAQQLKAKAPNLKVSVLNASDPDVTLGNVVGEYTYDYYNHSSTTEENFTAVGTNGIMFDHLIKKHGKCKMVQLDAPVAARTAATPTTGSTTTAGTGTQPKTTQDWIAEAVRIVDAHSQNKGKLKRKLEEFKQSRDAAKLDPDACKKINIALVNKLKHSGILPQSFSARSFQDILNGIAPGLGRGR